MQTIVIDDLGICPSVIQAGYAKMAGQIDVLFGLGTQETLYKMGVLISTQRGFDAAFAKLLWPLVYF